MLRYILFGSMLFFSQFLSGQVTANFHHLGISDGLSQNFIRSILPTSDGYVWIGTQVGLDRYDSHDFRHFRHDSKDPNSLPRPDIWSLFEDNDGQLWVGSQEGLARYNDKLEHFDRFAVPELPSFDPERLSNIRLITEVTNGWLWVATEGGLLAFDRTNLRFEVDTNFLAQQAKLEIGVISALLPTNDGRLLVAGEGGGYLLDPSTLQLSPLWSAAGNELSWQQLAKTVDGHYLAGTSDGLLSFTLNETDTLQQLVHQRFDNDIGGNSNFVADFQEIREGEYYAATSLGLRHFKWSSGQFELIGHFTHDPELETSLNSDQAHCLAHIADNWLWVGGRHGISILDTKPSPINLFSINRAGSELCSDGLKGMALSPNERYLLLGGDLGLTIIDLETRGVRCLNTSNFPDLRNDYIINVESGPEPDSYWLCFRRGGADLLRGVQTNDISIERIMYPTPGTAGTGVYEAAQTADGRHWLATGKGLYFFDPNTGEKELITQDKENPFSLPDTYIFSLLVDHDDRLWIGMTRGGLARMENEAEGSFTSWRADAEDSSSLINNMILDMIEDREHRVWLATPGGISIYLGDEGFKSFTSEDGLPSNLVFGLLEDDFGNVWISTPGGLAKSRFNERSSTLEVLDAFHTEDGLPIARAQYGFMRFPNGNFALAGGGVQIFHPDSLKHDQRAGPIKLTSFTLFNEPVTLGGKGDIVASVETLGELSLSAKQNFPAFSFADINYHPLRQVAYEYRLLGMHDNWLNTQGRRHLSFPRLAPGHYQLEIRALNPGSGQIGPVKVLRIHLRRPWYKRWWAYGLYLTAFIGLIWAWQQHRIRQRQRVEDARTAEREAFRRRSARDFHDEAGNHLTRVGLLTEVARRQATEATAVQPLLDQIDANVQVLREGMRDFIWALDPEHDNAYELILRLKRFGQEMFSHHPAQFSIQGLSKELEGIRLRPDQRRHLVLIIKEAMHNSLKHAQEAAWVRLSVLPKNDQLEISWADGGAGLPKDIATEGNGLKNMRARAAKIAAQLSMNSDERGTLVKLIITHLGDE